MCARVCVCVCVWVWVGVYACVWVCPRVCARVLVHVRSQLPCTNIPLLYKRPPPSQLGEVDEDDAIMTLGDAGHEVGFHPHNIAQHNTTRHNSFRLNSTAVAPPTHSLAPSPGHCNDPLRPHLSVFHTHTHTHTHRHTHTHPYASACGIVQDPR